MKKSFFDYLECSTARERDEIAEELKAMYNRLLSRHHHLHVQVFKEHKENLTLDYQRNLAQIGTIQGVFEILHIDYEMGVPFDDAPFPI